MSANKEPQAITNPEAQLDERSQKAFQLAVEFYNADKDLTREERGILSRTYATISYTTLGVGWGTFFAITAIPFYRQKLKTGSAKGTNVGLAILFGMAGMMVASPIGANKAYNWQLEKLRESNANCYRVAKILKPSESTKWLIYYNLTKDHPEHIMKDPRSKEAAIQRAKTIYSGRDPLGLYSGPRAEIAKGPSDHPYPGEEVKVDDDPFNDDDETKKNNETYDSRWQKIRQVNGIKDDSNVGVGASWSRIRNQQGSPFSSNGYNQPPLPPAVKNDAEQSEFDKLLEQERYPDDVEKENERW